MELAEGGTLFLDEVGELAAASQAKLLEFLQDHTFQRVGGLRTLKADVRLVAATNRDLVAESAAERFRKDLYFRLAGLEVVIPPLRERAADAEALAWHCLSVFCARYKRSARFAADALPAIRSYEWPGNVRELEHVVERAVALAEDGEIRAQDLFPGAETAARAPTGDLREDRREFEKDRVLEALRKTDGNRTEAARLLGLSRRGLQMKLRALGIT